MRVQDLIPILTRLFETSYYKGIFPDSLSTTCPQLLPVNSKVLELIINWNILKYLEKSQLHDKQNGFRYERYSAELLNFVTHRNKSFEIHGGSQAIAFNILNPLVECRMLVFFINSRFTVFQPNCVSFPAISIRQISVVIAWISF